MPDFIRDILQPMNRQCGDQLPVSAFVGMEDGTFPRHRRLGETRDRAGGAGLAAGGLYPV
jgi:pyruvate-ferredoxin/flavodoxin oxidoreductase